MGWGQPGVNLQRPTEWCGVMKVSSVPWANMAGQNVVDTVLSTSRSLMSNLARDLMDDRTNDSATRVAMVQGRSLQLKPKFESSSSYLAFRG